MISTTYLKLLSKHALITGIALMAMWGPGNAQPPAQPASQFSLRTDLIPPSPNAAALGKYGTVPVSLQTGIPNISIPITEAAGQQLKIPIALNYHNNGFKPSEEASWVGLGWSLDAGGVITRIIKDKVDEDQAVTTKYQDIESIFHNPVGITQDLMEQAMFNMNTDTEPDIYAFNFGGYSGKFILSNGIAYQFPFQQLTIMRATSTDGFTIITPDGTVYKFWQPEISNSKINETGNPQRPAYNPPVNYTSSWYLNTVTSADGKDNITLTYNNLTPEIIDQPGPVSQSLNVLVNGSPSYTFSPIGGPFPLKIKTLRLLKIKTSKMEIDFNPTAAPRQDMISRALDNIQVYNYQGELINTFKFDLDYFNISGQADTKRLKLTGLEEGLNPTELKKHFFFYNSDVFDSKTNPGVDHWGFANGSSTLSSIIPQPYNPNGPSREPNFTYANQGMLNRIVYPTGGSTVFEFEPNLTNNGLNYVMNTFTPTDFISRPNPNNTDPIVSPGVTFQIITPQTVIVNLSRTPKPDADPTKNFTPDVLINGPANFSFSTSSIQDNAGKTTSAYLPAGTYTLIIQCDKNEDYVFGNVIYQEPTTQVIEGKPGPGLRIKRITNYAGFLAGGSPASVKEYTYKDDNGVSTGVLLNIPYYGGEDYYENGSPISHYQAYTAANGNGLSQSQPMYYQAVYEKQVNGTDYLLSKSEYQAFGNSASDPSVQLVKKTDYRNTAGVYNKLTEKSYAYAYVADQSLFAIKPFVFHRDVPGDAPAIRLYTYQLYSNDIFWMRLKSETDVMYFAAGGPLTTTKSFAYDAGQRNTIYTFTNDSKGNTLVEKNKYPESYSNSFSSSLTSKYVYAPVLEKQQWFKRSATDSVLTGSIITDYDPLLAKPTVLYGFNSLAPVAALDQDAKDGNGQYAYKFSNSTGFEQRVLNTYDANTGNLISQDLTGSSGPPQMSYLWGYHNNYVIAQVKNALISTVAYTSFEDDDASWTYTAGSIDVTDARTGVNCYNGTMSKTGLPAGNYTVSLWARGSGTVTVGGVAKTITAAWAAYDWQLTGITSVTINTNGNKIDEVRLLPPNAMMNSYTYEPQVGVRSITDTKGLTQFFEYDDMKRILNVKDEQGNILKNYTYNYAVQQANWVNTGSTQCVQGPGGNTGEQMIQQQDNNTVSPTYQQLRWISNGTNTTACPLPVTIYIEMFSGSSTTDANGNTFRTVTCKAFQDANGTTPVNVPVNLSVNYEHDISYTFPNDATRAPYTTTGAGSVTIPAGANQATIGSIEMSGCQNTGTKQICQTASLSVLPGNGYQTIIIDP